MSFFNGPPVWQARLAFPDGSGEYIVEAAKQPSGRYTISVHVREDENHYEAVCILDRSDLYFEGSDEPSERKFLLTMERIAHDTRKVKDEDRLSALLDAPIAEYDGEEELIRKLR